MCCALCTFFAKTLVVCCDQKLRLWFAMHRSKMLDPSFYVDANGQNAHRHKHAHPCYERINTFFLFLCIWLAHSIIVYITVWYIRGSKQSTNNNNKCSPVICCGRIIAANSVFGITFNFWSFISDGDRLIFHVHFARLFNCWQSPASSLSISVAYSRYSHSVLVVRAIRPHWRARISIH